MRRFSRAASAVALSCCAVPAAAQDRAACGKALVCASDPQTVLQAMRAARLDARLAADGAGDPMVQVTGRPYRFDVYFYGCEQHRHCDSLRFEVSFAKDPQATVALANKWNAAHRFVTASVKENGAFVLSYDIGTIGGTTQRNFADTLDWWNSMLGETADFFAAELRQ